MYLRRNPKVTTQVAGSTAVTSSSPSSSSPSGLQQAPAAQDAVVTANPSAPVPVTSSSTPPQVERNADVPAPVSATQRNSITTGSEHVSQKSTAATSRPAISIST